MLRAPLAALPPKSQTSPAALRRELAAIRRRGWELAVDDIALGLAAVGVPVRSARSDVVAALSIAGRTPHLATRGARGSCRSCSPTPRTSARAYAERDPPVSRCEPRGAY